MSNPNPLVPQGSFQAQAIKGASNVRIAVATIVAIHVVFFGGLLLQGCKRDAKTGGTTAETNTAAANLTLPPIDTQYYTNATHLPSESTTGMFTNPTPEIVRSNSPTFRDTLAPSNFGSTATPTPPADTTLGGAKEYTVARGDTLAKIAAAHGTTVNAMRKANPTVDPAKLRAGMKIQIPAGNPAKAASTTSTAGVPVVNEASGSAPSGNSYTVKAGDTLTKVAKAHGITVSQLRSANTLKTSGLKVGQKLKIPAPAPATNSLAKPVMKKSTTNNIAQ